MFGRSLEVLEIADILALRENEVAEGRQLDYKDALNIKNESERKEFLADVSAFANSSGGYLIFGVTEKRDEQGKATGLPGEIPGLPDVNANDLKLRVEEIIRSGIAPRIGGVHTAVVPGFEKGPVVIVHVPKSWVAPHMVTLGGSSRFYARNSAGKYPLDVGEIRSAFALSESLPEKVRAFRAERIAQIRAGEMPVNFVGGPKIILHLVPVSAFSSPVREDVTARFGQDMWLDPIRARGHNLRRNFDGLLWSSDGRREHSPCDDYVQLFRDGRIEAVNASLFLDHPQRGKYFPGYSYEEALLKAFQRYFGMLKALDVDPPIVSMLTIVDAKGYQMAVKDPWGDRGDGLIDRDVLAIPEAILEDYETEYLPHVKPMFDMVWQSCGFNGSDNFKDGKFVWQ